MVPWLMALGAVIVLLLGGSVLRRRRASIA
jgi:LPXTG-motif cell wall-anchored protein